MGAAPDEVTIAFGRAVRSARIAQGLSQQALANAIDAQRTYITDVEHGRRNVTLRTMARLAAALAVPTSQLVADVDLRT